MTGVTRFIWECLGAPGWAPERGGQAGQPCWLCGGPTPEAPWRRHDAISQWFTNNTLARAPASEVVCQPCAYLASGDAWREYCAAHPEMGLKSVHPLSWRTYSHVFAAGIHACPARSGWMRWLEEPPEPPFVFVLAESGQKHLLFRAAVASSRERFPMLVEESLVLVDRARLLATCRDVEALLKLGFTRDEVRSGRYSQGRLKGAVMAPWWELEGRMVRARETHPDDVRIACQVAPGRPAKEEPNDE